MSTAHENEIIPDQEEKSDFEAGWRKFIIVLISVGIIIAGWVLVSDFTTNEPDYVASAALFEKADVEAEGAYTLGQKANAGSISILANRVDVTKIIGNQTTDGQFIIVNLDLVNDDQRARDVASSQFKLEDRDGKVYQSSYAASIGGVETLGYETLNPGIGRNRNVIFETPEEVTGLKLLVDSGVLLMAEDDKQATIYLAY